MASAAAAALPTLGKAAAAATVGGGVWGRFAWGYSRSLYFFDNEFRFDRMSAGYEFANTQMDQYRGDLTSLTELTSRKMGIYTVIATMGMAIMIALFCAGRLGLHGPSPPVWIQGLFLTNSGVAFCFMGTGIWLGLHTMWRANAAMVHLLSRKVRVMIPTRKKLDDARKWANQWEHQKIRDLARLPYVSDAVGWKWSGEVPDCEHDGKKRPHSAPPERNPGPCWLEEEFAQERVGIAGGDRTMYQPDNAPPDHFQLYRTNQKEWFSHDCYARVCIFYGFLTFFHACGFYGLGHINVELRAFWPAFSSAWVFATLHFLMLKFDIVTPTNAEIQETLPYCQYCGTLALIIASVGMGLDFRVEFSMTCVVLTWVCIFLAYVLMLVYALRLLECVYPANVNRDAKSQKGDSLLGDNWWPIDWKAPAYFQHVLYFVAPPSKLQPGQTDTVRELKEGYYGRSKTGAEGPRYLIDDLTDRFKCLLHEQQPSMSPQQKKAVESLHSKFMQAVNDKQLMSVVETINSQLDTIEQELGMGNEAAGSGSGSDYSDNEGSKSPRATGSYDKSTPRYHPDSPEYARFSQAEPWRLVAIITGTYAFCWVFLIFGMVIDCILGVQGLVTAPHWAKPPMTRSSHAPWERGTPMGLQTYSGDRPWIPEELYWHENMRPGLIKGWLPAWQDTGHGDRRLAARDFKASPSPLAARLGKGDAQRALRDLFSSIPSHTVVEELLSRKPTQTEVAALSNLEARFGAGAASWTPEELTWPGFFEPRMIACGPSRDGLSSMLAITPRGVAAQVEIGVNSANSLAKRFVLSGLANYPPLLSASWAPSAGSTDGLMLVSKAGDLLHCPETVQNGRWACAPVSNAPRRVPVAGGLAAAAVGWFGGSVTRQLHAAVISESSPDMVVLWALDGNTEAASWLPLGELPVPQKVVSGIAAHPSLSFVNDGELLLVTADGATIHRRITDGTVVKSTPALEITSDKQSNVQWQAACGMHDSSGRVMHLSLREFVSTNTKRPEVMVANLVARSA